MLVKKINFFRFSLQSAAIFLGETEQIFRFNNDPSPGPLVVLEMGKNKFQWFRKRQHNRQKDGWILLTPGVPCQSSYLNQSLDQGLGDLCLGLVLLCIT